MSKAAEAKPQTTGDEARCDQRLVREIGLTVGERLACFRWHKSIARQFREIAEENRKIAEKRGMGWQAHLRKTLTFDRKARDHDERARIFLPNAQDETRHEKD